MKCPHCGDPGEQARKGEATFYIAKDRICVPKDGPTLTIHRGDAS